MANNSNNGGFMDKVIVFLGALVLIFITLKLIGIVKWSWWWVLGPIWIPLAIILAAVVIWALIIFMRSFIKTLRTKPTGGRQQ
jgi:hypothetical protein